MGAAEPSAQGIHGHARSDDALNPVELLRALIRFDTSNPPGNERACDEFVAALLRERGIEPLVVGLDPERPNLIARLPGRSSPPPLLLYGHLDVVPANPAEWTRPRSPPNSSTTRSGEGARST